MRFNAKRDCSLYSVLGLLACCGSALAQTTVLSPVSVDTASAATTTDVPRFDHVVLAIMENTSESSIIGNTVDAPYINMLANSGAQFSESYAITHPSEPNYLALFSGSTHGLHDDSCPHTYGTANLGSQLIAAGFTFTGYSEDMPSNGYTGCSADTYARKHNPWVNFTNVPSANNLTYASFPTYFSTLPTLSIMVPNLCHDMHNCSISTGDTWLRNNLDSYVHWAKTHNSLFILTWDEDDSSTNANQIPTIFAGADVANGTYSETINHYDVLATLETMYGLGNLGGGAAITDVWSDRIFANGFDGLAGTR